MKRPFAVIGLTVFFVTAFLFEFETGVTVIALFVFAAALVISLLFKAMREHRFLPTFFVSGAVACLLLLSTVNFSYLPVLAFDGRSNSEIKAELIGMPEYRYGNCYYESRVFYIDGEETDFKARLVFSTPPEAEPYDIVEGRFNLFALGASSEDAVKSYKAKGVWLGGYPVGGAYNIISISEAEKPLAKKIIDIRAFIKDRIYRVLPDDRGGLAVALLIGDKSGLTDEINADFNEVGISHVICVSGFHLSLWSMLILKILDMTGIRRKPSSVIAAVGVVAFMLVAGLTYSVVRAGIMMLVCLFSNMIMRRRDSLNSLGFALMFITLCDPFATGAVSLRLSALATLGIILYDEYVSADVSRLIDKINNNKLRKVINSVVSSLMITVSATAFTLPISMSIYGRFNFLSFVANLIIVPVAGWCMIVSSIGAVLGVFIPSDYNIVIYISKFLLGFVIDSAEFLALNDFLNIRINDEKLLILLCGIYVFCVATVFISQLRKPVYSLAALLCSLMFTVSTVFFSVSESKETKITVFGCGNSESVLVSCNGENMILGCGGEDFYASSRIINAVSSTGNSVHTVVVPYLKDNSGENLMRILASYKPKRIYADELPDDAKLLLKSSEVNAFDKLSASENISAQSFEIGNIGCTFVETDDVSLLICFDPAFNYNSLPEKFRNADIFISRASFPVNTSIRKDTVCVLSAEENRADIITTAFENKGVRCYATGGDDLVIRALNGSISINSEEE